MNQSRDQLLATAGFAADVHRCLAVSQFVDLLAQAAHGQRVSEQAPLEGASDARRLAHCADHKCSQSYKVHGLGQKVESPGFQGVDGGFQATVGADHRHRQLWMALLDVLQQFQARTVGQRYVGQAQVELLVAEQASGFTDVAGGRGVEFHSTQGNFEELANVRFVINDQDSWRWGHLQRCVHPWANVCRRREGREGCSIARFIR
ncbi:hypothetical protein D3C85_916170 [compost metagenome]